MTSGPTHLGIRTRERDRLTWESGPEREIDSPGNQDQRERSTHLGIRTRERDRLTWESEREIDSPGNQRERLTLRSPLHFSTVFKRRNFLLNT
ncbi:hypothetical protein NHX12_022298 [Muraenolepis orangiensis]|uniref:Uncharacterized protein n=1 Tax=Muraenolepis orangiensis TaxID=630683 RepID=A0A9Q0EMZ1_9TELE|nr:hypothetical protein NHX12_022298 [Muraenolepis orangiensis]